MITITFLSVILFIICIHLNAQNYLFIQDCPEKKNEKIEKIPTLSPNYPEVNTALSFDENTDTISVMFSECGIITGYRMRCSREKIIISSWSKNFYNYNY